MPQVYKILSSRSVEGIQPSLFEVDTVCNSLTALFHLSKGHSFNTYGETASIPEVALRLACRPFCQSTGAVNLVSRGRARRT